MKFKFVYVISTDDNPVDAIELLKNLRSQGSFYWLGSYGRMKNTQNLRELNISPHEFFLDNDGYSFYGGAKLPSHVPMEKYTKLAIRLAPSMIFPPDLPTEHGNSSREMEFMTKLRYSDFCAYIRNLNFQLKQTHVCVPIHGLPINKESRFQYDRRERWIETMDEATANVRTGWAVKLFLEELNRSLKAAAYFAMQPWAHQSSICHLLGIGGVHYLPMVVFLASRCYEELSLDSSNYTVEAQSKKIFVNKNPNGGLHMIPLSKRKFNLNSRNSLLKLARSA